MNTISWLIYLGDLGAGAANFGTLGFLAFTIAGGATVAGWIAGAPGSDEDADALYVRRATKRVRLIAWPLCAVLWATAVFLPSKNAVYAIAISEVGHKIATNGTTQDIANDALKALHIWIKKQIDPETKK